MKKFVVMSGGFHPFHAGHASLYQQAKEAFPDATVLVCATNVQKDRPFPFKLKQKLAQLSGVPPKDFIEVSRQFSIEDSALAKRIGDPNNAIVIYVRSDKDRNEQPQPWRLNPDGSIPMTKGSKNHPPRPTSDYLLEYPKDGQPLEPASKHVYMAYLKTVKFGGGLKSASEIRAEWPTLDNNDKLNRVMSLYPATQKNPKLAQNVVGMFDQVMGAQQVTEGLLDYTNRQRIIQYLAHKLDWEVNYLQLASDHNLISWYKAVRAGKKPMGESALKDKSDLDAKRKALQDMEREPGHDKEAIRQRKLDLEKEARSKGLSEDKDDLFIQADPESDALLRFAQQHYPTSHSRKQAFIKFVQRALKHSEEEDTQQDKEIAQIKSELNQIQQDHKKIMKLAENSDYLEEK